jgi:hypothetical protein
VLTALASDLVPQEPPQLALQLPPAQQQRQGEDPSAPPVLHLSADRPDMVRIHNTSPSLLHMVVGSAGDPAARRLPLWLDVVPTSAVLAPGAYVDLMLRGPAPGASLSSGAAPLQPHEALLQVYAQHLADGGTGALARTQQHQPPILLGVRHTPY